MAAACLFEWFSLQQAQVSAAMAEVYYTRSSLSGLYTYTDNSTPTPPKLGPATDNCHNWVPAITRLT